VKGAEMKQRLHEMADCSTDERPQQQTLCGRQ